MSLEVDKNSIKNVTLKIREYDEKVRVGLLAISRIVAKKMEGWAKENASWTDRTSDGRKGLTGNATWESYTLLTIIMSHKVPYGVWLELAHQRKYSVLEPAIEKYKDEFIKEWKAIVEGVK